jgi:hypothetical protein
MLSRLAVACRDSVILLLFFGFFGHNMLRFNWLWLAGFAMLCRKFSEEVCAESDINELGRNISGQEYFPTDRCGEATTRAATGGWESTV